MGYIETLVFVTVLAYVLYRWCTATHHILSDRNIPHEKPLPLIGNARLDALFGKSSFFKTTIEDYNKFKDKKIYGSYSFRHAAIIIRDVNLIKTICTRDFDHFLNHRDLMSEMGENLFKKTLFMLRDRKWKEMRSTLSPSFTGNKMRLMFGFVDECCAESVKYISDGIGKLENGNDGLDVEMKDFFTRYTNDVIATTAFGIKVNSFEQKDNEFFTIGTTVTKFTGWALVKMILLSLMPKLMKLLRIKIINEQYVNYFKRLVFDAIKCREDQNIIRPDMIQLLMEAQRNFQQTKRNNTDFTEHSEFTDEDLLAQCFLFFVAGFDTVATCLCCTAHELLMNQDIQEKLYAEIVENEKRLEGKVLNYETLMSLKYLDQVVSESLRKWPPVIFTDRECTADYKLMDDDGNFIAELKMKDIIMIPIIAIHHDPQFYENPKQFDPERFSNENKANLNGNAYMPFGVGNRSCIGNRFALMETKLIIYRMVKTFKLLRTAKTYDDLYEAIKGFQLKPPEGFWIKLMPRS